MHLLATNYLLLKEQGNLIAVLVGIEATVTQQVTTEIFLLTAGECRCLARQSFANPSFIYFHRFLDVMSPSSDYHRLTGY